MNSFNYEGKQSVILLIEDNKDHATLIQIALKKLYPEALITWVEDGEMALHYISCTGKFLEKNTAPQPTLILLDLNLPKLDGFTILNRIRTNPVLKSVPICILTTSCNPDDIKRCYSEGADTFLTKPSSYLDLKNILKQLNRNLTNSYKRALPQQCTIKLL